MSEKWVSAFHERITKLYQEARDYDYSLTQEGYATRLGTTRSALRGWLAGKGQPDAEGFARIADIENVSVDWLVGRTDIRNPHQIIAAHRTDDPTNPLPKEALDSIEDFKKFIYQKYGVKYD